MQFVSAQDVSAESVGMTGFAKSLGTNPRIPRLKKGIFLLLTVTAIYLAEHSFLRVYLVPERFQQAIDEAGMMGPVLFIFFGTIGMCCFIPGTFFITAGVALFGPFGGFACVWPAAIAGASVAFVFARVLGRESLVSIIGDRLKTYDDLIQQNGFRTVLFLRLMSLPFAPASYALGLTSVRFCDYLFGTALGETASIFAITFFISTLRDVWFSRNWDGLFSCRMALSIACLAALTVVIRLVHKKTKYRFKRLYAERLQQD